MGYNYNQGGMGMPPVAPPTSTNAIISLVAGIVGLFFLPVIGGIVAILTGNSAKKEIANSGGTVGGEGLAKAGVIIGWVGLILWVLGICVGTAIFAVPFCLATIGIGLDSYNLVPVLLALL
ncbi:MAG TPA: DUF4190 domain-containing protein [Anaerolineales bacterium]|nr:DUF4190 domain-containing protein [Anaerolineales bacterium]